MGRARMPRSAPKVRITYTAAEIATARNFMAELGAQDPIYLPIFIRLDEEAAIAAARERFDPVAAARAIAKFQIATA